MQAMHREPGRLSFVKLMKDRFVELDDEILMP